MISDKSLTYHESAESKRCHADEAWDPEWIEYVFTLWATCSSTACKQSFAISGTGGVEPVFDDERGTEWYDMFSPMRCIPMPDIIEIPTKCPDNVSFPLREAFNLFWGHRGACAGRIRVALECLMNHLGIPKRKKGKNGKFFDLSLHGRLDHFAAKDPQIGSQLLVPTISEIEQGGYFQIELTC